jgi:Cdc6-like AAA superfamily ATPase
MILHGPSGTGKTAIASSLLKEFHTSAFAEINCTSYSSSKQLIKAIWFAILCSGAALRSSAAEEVRANRSRQGIKEKDVEFLKGDNGALQCRVPNTFGDFALLLPILLKNRHRSQLSGPDRKRRDEIFYLLLDNIDAADALEKGLRSRLLRIAEVNRIY